MENLELKNTIIKIKISMEGPNNRIKTTKERISKW